jgi:large repetitive protein
MSKKFLIGLASILFVLSSAYFISCSKPSTDPPPAATCADKTIVINGTTTNTSGGTTTNGAITVSATGSTGFTYSVSPGTGAFQSSGSFTGLAAGTYTVTAKDDAGCTSTKSYTVAATACPTITITAVLTQATNATAANGAINATATGSTGLTYSLGTGAFQASGNFTGLIAGTYQITAKDVNGCTNATNFTVTAASCPTITVATSTTQSAGPTATNGSITVTSSTGGLAPYTFSLNGGAFQGAGVTAFNNLLAGNYTIVAKDQNGCLSASTPVVVSFTPCPTITVSNAILGSDKCTNNTGRITVTATGSTGFTYTKDGGTTYQASNIFNSLATGNFTVGVKDANGCVSSVATTVPVAAAGPLFASVKALMTANCAFAGCHAGINPPGTHDFTVDCTIVTQSARIKLRAVDANPSVMPPTGSLSTVDKQKITDWINAGGQHSN